MMNLMEWCNKPTYFEGYNDVTLREHLTISKQRDVYPKSRRPEARIPTVAHFNFLDLSDNFTDITRKVYQTEFFIIDRY